jgi:hypothetical protein
MKDLPDRGGPELVAESGEFAVNAAVSHPLSGSRTRLPPLTCRSGCAFVLVDQAAEDRSASDSLPVGVRGGVIRMRWEES